MTFRLRLQNTGDASPTVYVDLAANNATVSLNEINTGAIPVPLPPAPTTGADQIVFDIRLVTNQITINCVFKDGIGYWRDGKGVSNTSTIQAYTNAEKLRYFFKYNMTSSTVAPTIYFRWGDDSQLTTIWPVVISNLYITNEPGMKDMVDVSITMYSKITT